MSESEEPTSKPSDTQSVAQHWASWRSLSTQAYAKFQAALEADQMGHPGLTDYAPADRAEGTQGTFAWWWGAGSEIRETINSINAWSVRLHEWSAWNRVVDAYGERDERWDVVSHFVEPIAFFCMLQPSSFADRLALTAETMLHQANRRVLSDYPDQLDQDARPGKPLRRSDRRKQLGRLGQHWARFGAFQQSLHALDGDTYRRLSCNFRDLASHSFSPRLMLGHISRAIRSIGPYQDLVEQPGGGYQFVDHPTKKAVSYAMSSLEPLPLGATYEANRGEFSRARSAMERFAELVEEVCSRMDQLPEGELVR
ncbi:MAG: hypothetical protein DI562_02010 [Stenotrophomonas acidaminiphila]|nr:MAG: hypothetical protein DI562_02010 [Stenotrophomonas acidaminiphila]